ncbi:MAG: 3-methyl-2-oxobutanoate hydroxymethyltransferase [Specibacter sp.]
MAPQVELLTQAGIPVMGHIACTPQSEHNLGGYRIQGRGNDAERLMTDAKALEAAGAFAALIEMVPGDTAAEISKVLAIATIGIGAGNGCDAPVSSSGRAWPACAPANCPVEEGLDAAGWVHGADVEAFQWLLLRGRLQMGSLTLVHGPRDTMRREQRRSVSSGQCVFRPLPSCQINLNKPWPASSHSAQGRTRHSPSARPVRPGPGSSAPPCDLVCQGLFSHDSFLLSRHWLHEKGPV